VPRTCRDVVEYFYASSGPVTVEVRPPAVPTPAPPPPLAPPPPEVLVPPTPAPPAEVAPPTPPRAEAAVRDYRYVLVAVAAAVVAAVTYLLRRRRGR
jgi:hypothetical protein